MSKKHGFGAIVIPSVTVFISSACIMILELVASRLIAKHLGSSLYTWTAVIGIVLAGITIGNYLGGRLADKFQPRKTVAVLFLLAAGACVVTIILNNLVGGLTFLWHLSWPSRVFCHVGLVFLLPSVVLGTISPVVAKMALDKELPQGRTVGDIYAFGAAGSIAGTFAAGYYLIAAMGTVAIIWSVAGVLTLMALLHWIRTWVTPACAVILIAIGTFALSQAEWAVKASAAVGLREEKKMSILYEDETPYCYVAVQQLSKAPDRRDFLQDKLKHSQIIMGNLDDLQYFYVNIFAGLTRELVKGMPSPKFMIMGGGGYVFPRYLKKHWPGGQVDVVEIDPGVTEAAMAAFGLDRDTFINTFHLDARNYVDEVLRDEGTELRYDFIYCDAINDYSVPFQLVTKEFNEKIYRLVSEDGLYMLNLIDTYNNAKFLGAMVNTLQETFEYVYVITDKISLPKLRNTYVVIGAKKEIDIEGLFQQYDLKPELEYFDNKDFEYLREKSDGIILTDDHAPIENLLSPVVMQSGKEFLAKKYMDRAIQLRKDERYVESVKKYKKAASINPSMTIKAYNEIGVIYVAMKENDKAAEAFQKAIDYHYNTEASQNIIGSLHLNLGILYNNVGNRKLSIQQLSKAVEQFKIEVEENPDSVVVWKRYADTLATLGDFANAAKAFQKCIELEPYNPNHRDSLKKCMERQKKK